MSAPRRAVLEREPVLDELARWYADVPGSGGALVLLAGEAGIGKSTVARELAARVEGPVWWGQCDPLTTPRPMSPLLDMAADPRTGLGAVLAAADRPHQAFEGLLAALRAAPTTVLVVVEDLHWADSATLDMLRFVGRRVDGCRALVLATYRDDDVGPDHPLRGVVGDLLRHPPVRRIAIGPLSPAAVQVLTDGSGLDAARVHAVTAGNPFFVTEVLAGGDYSTATVRDAVMARVGRLDQAARRVVEVVATDPREVELDHALALSGGDVGAVDRAVASGTLVAHGDRLRFRHELARLVVEGSAGAASRRAMHARLLELILSREAPDLSRVAHHAIGTGDPEQVLRHGPAAARQAHARGARREAAAVYAALEPHLSSLPHEEQVALRLEHGVALNHLDRPEAALAQARRAEEVAVATGEPHLLAEVRLALARCLWQLGRVAEADATAEAVLRSLRPLGASALLSAALTAVASNAMLGRHHEEAVRYAEEAVAVARALGDPAADHERAALVILGAAHLVTGDPGTGIATLAGVLDEAVARHDEDLAARCLMMLGSGGGEARRYDAAHGWLEQGTTVARARDQDYLVLYDQAWRARIRFEQGRWDEAVDLAAAPAAVSSSGSVIGPLTALSVLGRVGVRRGDPSAVVALRRALELGAGAELQHRWPAHCGVAELHWLAGEDALAREHLRLPYAQALTTDSPWARGELGYWLWRVGGLEGPPPGAAAPFALLMEGRWAAAAERWHDLGCPYEEALALAEGDVGAQLEALAILHRLGARPLAARVRAALLAAGVEAVPRGPRPATRADHLLLTPRQVEVHRLLLEGLTYAEIARRLFISVRTVEHHASAVLAKHGVTSREDLGHQA